MNLFAAALLFAAAMVPRVDIVYGPHGTILDRTCASTVKNAKATPELIEAAAKKRPELVREWTEHGTRYVRTALDEIGAPFPYGEMQAYLSVCGVSTMSSPLIVNVRQYLSDAERPVPLAGFSEALFHELMHHYVTSLTQQSALRRKYEAEDPVVLAHLHVIALEKFVLTKLGEDVQLKRVEQAYRTSPVPAYARAWEIVETEGAARFIDDLKAAARQQSQ